MDRLRAIDERLDIRFEPDLLPSPRFPSDHRGVLDFERSPADQERFIRLVEGAEVLYGIPGDTPEGSRVGGADGARAPFRPGDGRRGRRAGSGGRPVGGGARPGRDRECERRARGAARRVEPASACSRSRRASPASAATAAARRWGHYPVDELRGRTVLVDRRRRDRRRGGPARERVRDARARRQARRGRAGRARRVAAPAVGDRRARGGGRRRS